MNDRTLRMKLGALGLAKRGRALATMSLEEVEALDGDWPNWAHDGQCPPGHEWRTWVMIAGRGYGKTRAGAEWIAGQVRAALRRREAGRAGEALSIALVGATIDDARRVMVEGRSGLLSVAADLVAAWHPSRRLLRFAGGSEAVLFSGASPDALRGPEHHLAWCDELAKWAKPGECWDMLQLGLRLGETPRALVTTTPRPGLVLRRIMAPSTGSGQADVVVTGGTTYANPHLPRAFVGAVEAMYAGTRLGRQELDGELLSDVPGALWTVEGLEACRVTPLPPEREGKETPQASEGEGLSTAAPFSPDMPSPARLRRVDPTPGHNRAPRDLKSVGGSLHPGVRSGGRGGFTRIAIGVDPPSGGGTCGIVVCAVDRDGVGHVLADHSVSAASPERWARAVADAAALYDARSSGGILVVAEVNQGGRMVESVLRAAGPGGPGLRLKLVRASEGKSARAEPVAMLFEQGRVRVHGRMATLEAELCGLIAGGGYDGPGKSPDRADAMVWALGELMLGVRGEPRVRGF